MQRCLDDGIRLGMNRANTVSIHHEMADLITVALSGRGAVEASGEDPLIEDEHTPDEGAVTGAAFGNRVGDLQKVRVPVWAHDGYRRCL